MTLPFARKIIIATAIAAWAALQHGAHGQGFSRIYREDNVYKARPYHHPGLDTLANAALWAQLKAVKNLPTTPAQELGFWQRSTQDIAKQSLTSGSGFGNTFFENEKSSYPAAMHWRAR